MRKDIDGRYITNEFLLDYFPSPDRYNELKSNPPKSTLAISEQRYISFRKNLNQERAKSGKPPLSDADLSRIIKHAEGYLVLPKLLKPNKQI